MTVIILYSLRANSHTHAHAGTQTRAHTHMQTQAHKRTHTNIHTHTHTHAHTGTQTHTHKHTHTQVHKRNAMRGEGGLNDRVKFTKCLWTRTNSHQQIEHRMCCLCVYFITPHPLPSMPPNSTCQNNPDTTSVNTEEKRRRKSTENLYSLPMSVCT